MANTDNNNRVITQALFGGSNSHNSIRDSENLLHVCLFMCSDDLDRKVTRKNLLWQWGLARKLRSVFILMAIWITSADFDKALIITHMDDAEIQTESFILVNMNPDPHLDHRCCLWALSRFSAKHCHHVWMLDFVLNRWEGKGHNCEVLLLVPSTEAWEYPEKHPHKCFLLSISPIDTQLWKLSGTHVKYYFYHHNI